MLLTIDCHYRDPRMRALLNGEIVLFIFIYITVHHVYMVICLPLQCADRFYMSESDVYRRRILTYEYGPCTEGI